VPARRPPFGNCVMAAKRQLTPLTLIEAGARLHTETDRNQHAD
jgi:7,8-dihydro-6-hydroxymethylpterin-pyrophosphokinase